MASESFSSYFKMKLVSLLWGFTLLAVIIILTCYGFYYKKQSKPYKDLESNLSLVGKTYYLNNNISLDTKVFLNDLLDEKIIDSLNVEDDNCTGYLVASNDNGIEVKAYLKCNKYKTKNYKE